MLKFQLSKLLAGVLVFSAVVVACYETDRNVSAPHINAEAVSGPALTKLVRAAGIRGRASLVFREEVSKSSDLSVTLGDTLTIEAFVDAAGDQVTGAVLLLSMDDSVLELIPQDSSHTGLVPFEQGEFMDGVVFNNDTINDVVGDPLANALPFFQLRYFENVQAAPFGEPHTATGSGVLARFKVRVVGLRGATIMLDEVSATGWEMGYFVQGKPGLPHRFDRTTLFRVAPKQVVDRLVTASVDGRTLMDVTLLRFGRAVADVEVAVAQTISGRPLTYSEAAETNSQGVARCDVSSTGKGYYTIRATSQDGQVLGRWNSVPVNPGLRHHLPFHLP
jgi:hypothetical protein